MPEGNRDDRRVVTLRGYGDTTTSTSVVVERLDGRRRVRHALAGLGAAWAGAFVSVFIPVAHFFLVPFFFGTGIYLLLKRLRVDAVITEARARCPDCSVEQDLGIGGKQTIPPQIQCEGCRRVITLSVTP